MFVGRVTDTATERSLGPDGWGGYELPGAVLVSRGSGQESEEVFPAHLIDGTPESGGSLRGA
jgi:hypothetical protein